MNEARERVQAEALDALARASAPVPNLPGDPVVFTSRGKAKASQPALYMSVANNAVWLRLPRGSAAAAQSKRLKFDHPKDRFGKVRAAASAGWPSPAALVLVVPAMAAALVLQLLASMHRAPHQ